MMNVLTQLLRERIIAPNSDPSANLDNIAYQFRALIVLAYSVSHEFS